MKNMHLISGLLLYEPSFLAAYEDDDNSFLGILKKCINANSLSQSGRVILCPEFTKEGTRLYIESEAIKTIPDLVRTLQKAGMS